LFVIFFCFIVFIYVFLTKQFVSKKDIFDVIIIPGGLAGARTISSNSEVQKLLASAHQAGKFVAAICAGPIAIKSANINKGGKITSHPIVKADLENEYNYQEDRVVVDNKVITRSLEDKFLVIQNLYSIRLLDFRCSISAQFVLSRF